MEEGESWLPAVFLWPLPTPHVCVHTHPHTCIHVYTHHKPPLFTHIHVYTWHAHSHTCTYTWHTHHTQPTHMHTPWHAHMVHRCTRVHSTTLTDTTPICVHTHTHEISDPFTCMRVKGQHCTAHSLLLYISSKDWTDICKLAFSGRKHLQLLYMSSNPTDS